MQKFEVVKLLGSLVKVCHPMEEHSVGEVGIVHSISLDKDGYSLGVTFDTEGLQIIFCPADYFSLYYKVLKYAQG